MSVEIGRTNNIRTKMSLCDSSHGSRPTHAVVASVDLHVVHRTDAGVVSNSVVAQAWTADTWVFTLIHICIRTEAHTQTSFTCVTTVSQLEYLHIYKRDLAKSLTTHLLRIK